MINLFSVHMPEAVDDPLLATLHSGYITQGKKVDEFEQNFSILSEMPFVVSVNSGTSALTLALRLAGVGPGDEVITTAMTCSATNLPILSLGAKPVFADIDLSGNVRPPDVTGRITKRTRAIMAVDWAGQPVDVSALMAIAKAHNLKVIVDAAHALGAGHNAQPDFLCYSLQAIKHITTVDGGILVCNNEADYRRAKKLRWFGIDRESNSLDSRIDEDITEWGYKFHMNDVAATIGIVQLQYVSDILDRHRYNASMYSEYLSHYFKRANLDLNGAYWVYTILLPDKHSRDEFKDYMARNSVQVSQVHRRNDEYSVFKPYANKSNPGLDEFSDRMVCLPCHWGLARYELDTIIDLCNIFAKEYQ